MSLMKSFSFGSIYGVTELPTEVLNLFLGLVENPEKKIEYASEIISAGLQGRIDFESEFNIEAYESAIRKNIMLGKENKRKKESFLDFSDSGDDWEEVSRNGGIKANTLSDAEQMEDAFEKLIMEDELKYAVATIKSLQPILLTEAKLDFIHTMKQALKGIPESVKLLKEVCKEYEVLAEQVEIVLSSGRDFNTIFA